MESSQASNTYDVTAVTLDASLLTQLEYNNQSQIIDLYNNNISVIDPNALDGYTQLSSFYLLYNQLSNLDFGLFKHLINIYKLKIIRQ